MTAVLVTFWSIAIGLTVGAVILKSIHALTARWALREAQRMEASHAERMAQLNRVIESNQARFNLLLMQFAWRNGFDRWDGESEDDFVGRIEEWRRNFLISEYEYGD